MTSALKIGIAGGNGRMGQALIEAVQADSRLSLSAISVRMGNRTALEELFARRGGRTRVTDHIDELVSKSDAVIDFTSPESTLAIAKAIARRGGIHIIGTTGFSEAQQKEIFTLSAQARIVQSGNFSLGLNVLARLVEQAAHILNDSYDIEISETHHKHKKDAPSGTALMLGMAAAHGRAVEFEKHKVLERSGERQRGTIGFSVQRGGDIVGIHNVLFAGPGETIEFKHQGFSRQIYAVGALHAALWAHAQPPALYSMREVLADKV